MMVAALSLEEARDMLDIPASAQIKGPCGMLKSNEITHSGHGGTKARKLVSSIPAKPSLWACLLLLSVFPGLSGVSRSLLDGSHVTTSTFPKPECTP